MQCLLQNLLTLHSNINSLRCTPTLIASFTSVFSSFTSVNVGKLQYTAVSPLTTGNINPKHCRLRGPRCITKQTCVVTFSNKLIFHCLGGCRHCNQITLSFYCVLHSFSCVFHRNQRTFQGFSLQHYSSSHRVSDANQLTLHMPLRSMSSNGTIRITHSTKQNLLVLNAPFIHMRLLRFTQNVITI